MLIPVSVGAKQAKTNTALVLSSAVACGGARTDVLWEPFPNKDPDKDNPEKSDALLLKEQLLPSVERIE